MTPDCCLNPGEKLRWYPNGLKNYPMIQELQLQELLDSHASGAGPECQCLTCLTGRRYWKERYGAPYPLKAHAWDPPSTKINFLPCRTRVDQDQPALVGK